MGGQVRTVLQWRQWPPRPEGYGILQGRKVRLARGNVSNVIKVEFVDELIDDMFILVVSKKRRNLYLFIFLIGVCIRY